MFRKQKEQNCIVVTNSTLQTGWWILFRKQEYPDLRHTAGGEFGYEWLLVDSFSRTTALQSELFVLYPALLTGCMAFLGYVSSHMEGARSSMPSCPWPTRAQWDSHSTRQSTSGHAFPPPVPPEPGSIGCRGSALCPSLARSTLCRGESLFELYRSLTVWSSDHFPQTKSVNWIVTFL